VTLKFAWVDQLMAISKINRINNCSY